MVSKSFSTLRPFPCVGSRYNMKSILFALLFTIGMCSGDTVLGGIVDYLPKCYATPNAMLYVEYNAGHCYRERSTAFYRTPCSCKIPDSSQRGKLKGDKWGKCIWHLKVDEYNARANTTTADIIPDNKANNAHNIPDLDLLYSRYHGGQLLGSGNYPVVQGISLTNKATRYIGISMWKGIKMIRLHYLKTGQRSGWSQGVQLRITDDFKKHLSKRDFDTHCFFITGLIPFERRGAKQHFINCMKIQKSSREVVKETAIYEGTNQIAEVINCEQGTNLQNIDTTPKDLLVEGLKHIASLGMSFIPVVGPFLSIGLDVTYNMITDKSKFDEIMKSAQVSAGEELFKLLTNVASKSITR
ncbi:uncharacterized protein BX664DRAFT_351371 [Halteromyces radiatus]|uniref:uncharacterized protein n=1 Tax=Halteromyces radiatus TaxID=101107 RepID=UPI00221E849A|nr:uncharacterized protein BX664DRAFT_351371 [Halteromyces radiatus]KAI8084577.1 hypothetical protein BX664DRAFT_351371 [Halteromyces radiatus]